MANKNKKNNLLLDVLKAARKASREEEIKLYGKPICHSYIEKTPKAYTRKVKHKNKYN